MFIVVEGADGSGKGTQSEILAKRLGAVLLKYPDRTTPYGKLIDRWLKGEVCLASVYRGPGIEDLPHGAITHAAALDEAAALQGLLLANKIEVEMTLKEALRKNGRVVADRYAPSAVAYGGADGLDREWLRASHAALLQPNLVVLLDVPTHVAMGRIEKRKAASQVPFNDDTYGAVMERVAKARSVYLDMADDPKWVIVDGLGSVEDVAVRVWRAVSSNLNVEPHGA